MKLKYNKIDTEQQKRREETGVNIVYHESSRIFHLYNNQLSYIMMVLPDGSLGQLYCGRAIHDREDFSYLLEMAVRPMASCVFDGDRKYSLEHIRQEYPVYGTSDYRHPAVEVLQENGSRISEFTFEKYQIIPGKPGLPGLPATYVESDDEAMTLVVTEKDKLTGLRVELMYTIFAEGGILARSVHFVNDGSGTLHLTTAMSMCLDLPDYDYDWIQLSGAWARERHIRVRRLEEGIQAVDSMRGHSSHEENPFVALKRPDAGEDHGEVLGFSFVYSGNFLIQAEVGSHSLTRVLVGINPMDFDWKLEPGETFQTPEAVMVYSDEGLSGMSRIFHRLYQKRLARGYWRDRVRPILINNWEATYMDFDEEKLLKIAKKASECGVELFVLDDGWFGKRVSDHAGLGDWTPNPDRLPDGIRGISEKIEALGMKFGLWFEPEMVNPDSDLYRAHPDWVLATPGRRKSQGRYQYVLDFSRKEVVDNIYNQMKKILGGARVSYVKWDMNRSITECYSAALPADRQGEVFHRYILGVYDLYERLTSEFPHILFESCASGGGRFDPGLLYYAPQAWTSDDTDAVERLKIQYGTSLCYPISSMGSHVSAAPNHQTMRRTSLSTRANVAYFGTFGYELDITKMTDGELEEVKKQISFMKKYRGILQFGTFYRLKSPFESNTAAWMSVSEDKKTAIVGWYRILNIPNGSFERIRLTGLDPEMVYRCSATGRLHYGDELMNLGLITSDASAGEPDPGEKRAEDFDSRVFVLTADTESVR